MTNGGEEHTTRFYRLDEDIITLNMPASKVCLSAD